VFNKILIANRGEIACRVIKTARRMGIATVAVFSDADRDALHVEMADEAVHIGPSAASQSYLVASRIVDACRQTGAEAVHPGYGFLSERASFCEALEAAGVVFIGPKADAIRAMGDKIESKKFASAAGVSTVPGYLGTIENAAHAAAIAEEIGYPVMIKASAGGGGKGMRIAWTAGEVAEGFERARSEAAGSFGDDRIFVEKFIVDPRHIEIQVLGDSHGNCIHLGERECSIQRRNQKVVEEAPSPFLDPATRQAMGSQAVALARAVGYQSAGTVEFIVDSRKNFYFLEMNTRLQVEHPVTELVTGLDLVEQMIRIAADERLSIRQEEVKLDGWAVESRLYAEDPFRNFLPSTGRLTQYRPPAERKSGGVTIRNDTGVTEGSEISMFYDPMLAKLCTHAASREEAVEAMSQALDAFVVDGVAHNIPFLAALMRHPRWREGRLSTSFIAEEYPDGFSRIVPEGGDRDTFVAVAAAIELVRQDRLGRLPGRLSQPGTPAACGQVVRIEDDYVDVLVSGTSTTSGFGAAVKVGGADPITIRSDWQPGDPVWNGVVGGRRVLMQVRHCLNGVRLDWQGMSVEAGVMRPRVAELERLMPRKQPADTSKLLLCPMPGLVVTIAVTDGQMVKAGETLAIVEAMKMENVLRADRDLKVARVLVQAGDSLAVDAVIMEFA
jgi:propionyl-CoA carboxylase alpha chain